MFEIIAIDELLKRLEKYNHKELHVHHTWQPCHKDFNGFNGIELQQAMRNYHVNKLGWNDIGQHVTLLPDGKFVTGRDFARTPASIEGHNTGAFACEILGNFDTGNDVLEGPQKESILRLARYFDNKSRYVRFHRENSPKTCPGTSINKNTFMKEVRSTNVKPQAAPKTQIKADNEALKMQQTLNRLKIHDGKGNALAEDGIPGGRTQEATKRFQSICNLNVDGIAGTNTWNAINEILLKPLLKVGSKGIPVRYVQYRVGVTNDGIFGWNTNRVVAIWQGQNGIKQDGIVGNDTWKKLIG